MQNGCSCFCRYSIPPHRLSPDSSFTQRIISGAWIKEIVDWCNEQVEDARAAMFLYQRFKEEWEQNLRHRVDPAYVNTLGTLRSQKAARWIFWMFVSLMISGDALGANEFLVLHALYLYVQSKCFLYGRLYQVNFLVLSIWLCFVQRQN